MTGRRRPKGILVIDVGGTHVKALVAGRRSPRRFESGPTMTARRMVQEVKKIARDWRYDRVSIGFPGPVTDGCPAREPPNLGGGWARFDFRRAFGRPVRIVNDAAMQALGSYNGGRMLFLGLGTGLGSALIVDGVLVPLELGHLQFRRRTSEAYAGRQGLKRLGKRRWRRHLLALAEDLRRATLADEVVFGGGNAKKLARLPRGMRRGSNRRAFVGGFRLWSHRCGKKAFPARNGAPVCVRLK